MYLTSDKKESERLNWFMKLQKVKSILNFWKMRNLTYYGKVVILKSLILSQFVYVASVLPIPPKLVVDLNKLMYNFLWNSKREKVKRAVLINDTIKGGLRMIDLKSKFQSLHLSWLSKFFENDNDVPWKFMFRYWIEKICPFLLILKTNCFSKDMLKLCVKQKVPDFYTDCLITWSELKYIQFPDILKVKKPSIVVQ